jgi:hypothetical protein
MTKSAVPLVILLCLLSFVCTTIADQPVPATPETQGLVTSTETDVVGIATETDVGAWTLTNGGPTLYHYSNIGGSAFYGLSPEQKAQLISAGGSFTPAPAIFGPAAVATVSIPDSLLNTEMPFLGMTWGQWTTFLVGGGYTSSIINGGIHTGTLNPGQVQFTTAYDASILGQAGHTVLVKNMNINTGNKVSATQSNLNARTLLTYVATGDGGNVVGSENLLIDGAGNSTPASDRMLCPFAGDNNTIIPAFCNIVQAGSSYDLTVGSVTTTANDLFVGTDATVPVVLNYNINVKPYDTTSGSIPAMGSTLAYIRAHIQEARGQTAYNITVVPAESAPYSYMTYNPPIKAEDLLYSESTSAHGVITTFSKSMGYTSQATSTPITVIPVFIIEAED